MTKDLKDQVKSWKKAHPAPPPSTKAAAAKAKPAPPPPPKKSDEELFLDAVAGVSRDAVLEKYDESPPPPAPKKSTAEAKADDEALFEQFVGRVDGKKR